MRTSDWLKLWTVLNHHSSLHCGETLTRQSREGKAQGETRELQGGSPSGRTCDDASATISTHGSSSSSSARRASTSSAASASRGHGGGGGGGERGGERGAQAASGRASTRRSPSKKPAGAAEGVPPSPAAVAVVSAGESPAEAAFNPLVALQSVVAGDLVPIKQRSKAAQQLATYFCELPTTPSLYAYYEPYLPILASVAVASVKAAKDVQENAIKMLKALASHSPRQFVEWCALHVSMDPTQEPWYVDWCGGLLLAAETRVPRLPIHDAANDAAAEIAAVWDERSMEYQELDAATAAVFHVWRSVLDNADDEDIVYEIAVGIKSLLCYQPTGGEQAWRALVTSKIQPHFVDMADVLIGWAMSISTSRRLRETIFALLEEMRELWIGNSVFCMQLLESFSSDIGAIYASPTSTSDDFGRLDSIILCSTLVAQFIPISALVTRTGQLGFVETLLRSSDPARFYYSSDTVLRLAEYFDALASAGPERFAALNMRAIRFLVSQVAYHIVCRRCDMHSALCILEKASGFARMLSWNHADADSRLQAKQLLQDVVVVDSEKQDRYAVLEVLLSMKYFAAVKYSTQIVIKTAVLIGMEGLELIATVLEKKLLKPGDPRISFWVTCFLLVCKDPQLPTAPQDVRSSKKTLELLRLIVDRAASLPPAAHVESTIPCALRLVPVFVSVLKKRNFPDLISPTAELVLAEVELSILVLRARTSDSKIVRDVLASLTWSVSSLPTEAVFSPGIQTSIVEQLQSLRAQDATAVREDCIRLLVAMAPRVSDRAVCRRLIGLATEIMNECDESERATLLAKVFPCLTPTVLFVIKDQEASKPTASAWKDVWAPSEMLVGDFERVFELLTKPETTSDAWYRTSRRIHARMRREQSESASEPSTLMKMIVREAAKWAVQNRLRSPLGPPSAIFSGVEKMLHVHANHHTVGSGVFGPVYQESASAMLLVEFVLAMEVLFSAATDLKCPDKNSDSDGQKVQAFFRANVAVCEEWLSRVRPTLVELSSCLKQCESLMHNCNAAVTVLARKLETHLHRHSASAQPDEVHVRAMKYTIDLEASMFTLAKSLCGLGDADTISGLQTWWGDVLSRLTSIEAPSATEWEQRLMLSNANVTWLEALACQAELKYEDAVKCYEAILTRTMHYQLPPQASPDLLLHPLLSPIGLSLNTFVGCMRECGKCLAVLSQWSRLRDLSGRCQAFALVLFSKWGRVPALAGLMDLCEAWKIEEALTMSLDARDDIWGRSSHSSPSFTKEEKIGARALAILEKWGALSIADRSSASSGSISLGPGDVNRVSKRVQLLRFRPAESFSDTLSPTSMRFHESTLLMASLLASDGDADRQQLLKRLQLMIGDVGEFVFDSTQWSRLYTESSHNNIDSLDPEWWLAMARAARKQKNYAFAASMLSKVQGQESLANLEASRLALLYENSVLTMTGGSCHDGVLALIKLCESVLQSRGNAGTSLSDSVHVRSLLRLARTLADVTTGDDFGSIEAAMRIMGSRIEKNKNKGLVEYRDNLVMVCLESATQVSPTNPQAWYEFSKWCHQQGRQSLEKIITDGGLLELLPSEEEKLELLLSELFPEDSRLEKDSIRAVFRHVMDGASLLSNHEERLRRALSGTGGREDLVHRFVAFQSAVVSRILRPIKDAATGYRSFLLTANLQTDGLKSRRDSSRITSVALRLLRILTRFGSKSELVDTVTDVFTSGPLDPWGRIVPQLLSRIGHSYADVSNPVAALLVRLARSYPHLVVYPAVVEAGRKQADEDGNSTGKKLLSDVLFELRSCAPDLVEGVGRMVDELKRISILWDDAWIWALVKMSGDVNRRISTLEKEAHRVDKNSSLSNDEKDQLARRKAVAIMTPVLVAVERLWIDTLGRAVPGSTLTPHEKQFAHKYGSTISKAIQVFRNYCSTTNVPTEAETQLDAAQTMVGSVSPAEVWQPFADFLKGLAAAVGRRERVDLAEVSPILARTSHKSKAALMPGTFSSQSLNLSGSEAITVSEVSRSVAILRTKTKPKCLKFVGSDGKGRRYLLKAREDLHLDERIMQFLETVNEFLRADRNSNARNLRARNYSVVPLSSDAGLIQIVPDVLPLFQMYTNRVEDVGDGAVMTGPAAAAAAAADLVDTTLPLQQPPTAPFYAKLKQYGIQDVAPSQRSRWPLSVLRRVHEDLTSARPVNVVSRELSSQSTDFADAWTKKYRFSRSTAVMSVLGYLVGLGDRHLDNMLLCANTGELLHIDYNVCFDKGRKLKVPEVVPFRLTPIIVDGLGLTGVDGVYRSAFMNTLRVVRDPDSREALLALLDAFVYDPLVDWVADGKNYAISRDTKQRMDVNVNLSLFLSRARERSRETLSFVKEFKALSSSVQETLAETAARIGEEVSSHGHKIIKATELKNLADEVVRQKEQDWAELSSSNPQQEASLTALLGFLDSDKARLATFAKQCYERHQHIMQLELRLSSYVPGAAIAYLPRTSVSGKLVRAHARIVSIAVQLPLSPSASVWMNMLTSLAPRCSVLDEQIPAIVDQCDHVVATISPILQEYVVRRGDELARGQVGGQLDTSSDVYGVWCRWCSKLLDTLERTDYADVLDYIRAIKSTLDKSSINECSRVHHAAVVVKLENEAVQLRRAIQMEPKGYDGSEVDILVQEFLNQLSALKLSNSQTQRVIRLVSTRWMLSALDSVEAVSEPPRNDTMQTSLLLRRNSPISSLRSISQVTMILRGLALTAKGSMKKVITEMLASGPRASSTDNDWVQEALESVSAVASVLDSIFTGCLDELIQRQYRVADSVFGPTAATNGMTSTRVTDELLLTLTANVEGLENARKQLGVKSDVLAAVDVYRVSLHQASEPRDGHSSLDVADRLLAAETTLASQYVVSILRGLVHHVAINEWNFSRDLNVTNVDSEAVEVMPASLESPLPGFQACCSTFGRLWSVWSAQLRDAGNFNEFQHRVRIVEQLQDAHRRHIKSLDWNQTQLADQDLGRLTRSKMLNQISLLGPTLPRLYEEIRDVESNLLEVAQQLEYVASQISFSCALGVSANEIELQAICRDVQDLYNQTSRHFEVTKELSDMVLGASTIETSLVRICGQTAPTSLELEVNQVGWNLLEGIAERADQVVQIYHHTRDSPMKLLQGQLQDAREDSVRAEMDVSAHLVGLTAACKALEPDGVFRYVTELEQLASSLAKLLGSLGVHGALSEVNEGHSSQAKSTPSGRKTTSQTKFALAENERLVKILHRSVEQVAFMQELNDVLTDHDQRYQQLQMKAAALSTALSAFCDAARLAVSLRDLPRCILAVEELGVACGDNHPDTRNVISSVSALLEDCCKRFFDAAQLADELTKADDLAPTFEGLNGQPGDEADNSEENGDEDMELLNEDLGNPADAPLRSLAEFQEQNRYGVDVVSRIDEKLGGVVVESGSRDPLSIEDQSSWLIRAATNVDNLCVMYEGWTPWI